MNYRRTTWLRCRVAGTALTAVAVAGAAFVAPASAIPAAPHGPENVIVLIGDGMGYNQIDQASLFEHGTSFNQVDVDAATGEVTEVPGTPSEVYQNFPVQVAMSTFSSGGSYDPQAAWTDFGYVNANPTDSAAAATAMATGVKTYNAGLGVDADGGFVENLSERAIDLGKAAGVVSSVPYSHATPAAYVVHNENRNNYYAIANEELTSDMTVVMGAGHPYYDASHNLLATPSYGYISEPDFAALAAGETDFTFVEERAEFEDLATTDAPPERVFGIPQVAATLQQERAGASDEPYGAPLNDVPSLATMTAGALNVLDAASEEGLFVMVEGGAIDWAGHAHDSARNIEETMEFNDAVDVVVDWVEENSSWKETLVVVTADHETGYLSGPDSDPNFDSIHGGAGDVPEVGWYSSNHTNQLVPVYAMGAGAKELGRLATQEDPVRGAYLDNTDLANVLLEDLWAAGPGASAGNGYGYGYGRDNRQGNNGRGNDAVSSTGFGHPADAHAHY